MVNGNQPIGKGTWNYSQARDVRVVFCDAASYDAGYMLPEDIAERVQIKGCGGTILQPGID